MKKKGRLIVLEGLTCSGKDLQAELLVRRLKDHGFSVELEVEPTRGPFGAVVRSFIDGTEIRALASAINFADTHSAGNPEMWKKVQDILAKIGSNKPVSTYELQLLFMADRFWHSLILLANMELGFTVVCARYELSTFAYGSSHGATLDELLISQDKILGKRYAKPDITVYIRVSPETAVERLAKSGKVRDIYEKIEDVRKTSAAYDNVIDFGREHGRFGKITEIDGEQPVEKVYASILAELVKNFPGEFKKFR